MPGYAVVGGRSATAWFGAPFASPLDPVLVVVPRGAAWDGPESWVRVACVRAGLPAPVPQFEVRWHGLLLGRVVRLSASDLRDLDAVVARIRAELLVAPRVG